jgi:hypothetical protein
MALSNDAMRRLQQRFGETPTEAAEWGPMDLSSLDTAQSQVPK